MLPTPDTSHVCYERVYEPAEDSFLLLDTLSSASETSWLRGRFSSAAPFVVEIGPGSGVVIAFVNAHAGVLFGPGSDSGSNPAVLTAAVDLNAHACRATGQTVRRAAKEARGMGTGTGTYLGASRGDLATALRPGSVDVLIFNPPYVPTPEMPRRPGQNGGEAVTGDDAGEEEGEEVAVGFDGDSYLLALSYAGGRDGMETTDRLLADLPRVLSARGCAYVLLCAQNRPEEVKRRVREGYYWGGGGGDRDGESCCCWRAETVGSSGKTAGWEKLQIIRIWRDTEPVKDGGGD